MFKTRKIQINAAHELVALLTSDDAKELQLNPRDKINIKSNSHSITCQLETVDHSAKHCPLKKGEIGLFEHAFEKLHTWENQRVSITPAPKPRSLELVKRKFNGHKLEEDDFFAIITDITQNNYSDIETTFFVLACSVHKLTDIETTHLTNAMVRVGKVLNFKKKLDDIIIDKHCIGGIPNNRTTLIVVPIIAAAGLKIPKTSSRSITSPAGTADTMEVFANVKVPLSKMYSIVEKENGCMVWGGSFDLSPADDIIIHVEHPLGLDFEVQMIASILSKKKSAGSSLVLIDIPYGKTAKVTTLDHAKHLKKKFEKIGASVGISVKCIITDGSQPIGNGIGPLKEALDVLKILKREDDAPKDLEEKSLMMAGLMLEMAGKARKGTGYIHAKDILETGLAYKKFLAILEAQGKPDKTPQAKYSLDIKAYAEGIIKEIDNKRISKIAFMLGAPKDKSSGLYLNKKKNYRVQKGEVLFTIYSNSKLKLKYAENYIASKLPQIYMLK